MKSGFGKTRLAFQLLGLIILCGTAPVAAEENGIYASQRQTLASVKRSYDEIQNKQKQKLLFSPVSVGNGVNITVIAPSEWRSLVEIVKKIVSSTHTRFEQLFGTSPAFSTTIRLMEEDAFFKKTGAPAWTNAMYYHGEIIIPIQDINRLDLDNIKRSIRHEYAHAIVHELSGGNCPGWLDEGIAQWVEGVENPALRPALQKWLKNNNPVQLSLLQGGFTRLEESMVPAAYAQSLFATTTLIQGYGFDAFKSYFKFLREGYSNEYAFSTSFSVHEKLFEVALEKKLREWNESDRQ